MRRTVPNREGIFGQYPGSAQAYSKMTGLPPKNPNQFFHQYQQATVPMETNKLLEIIAEKSSYALNSYHRPNNCIQVLVIGHVHTTGIFNFFKELMHDDHGNLTLHAVVLSDHPPSGKFKFLPFFTIKIYAS